MIRTLRSSTRCRIGLATVVLSVGLAAPLVPAGTAAATPIPFQIEPAPFGNPNGSLDVPSIHCSVETGPAGVLTITGGLAGRWGCLLDAQVSWINLTTMATGVARISNGLNGIPPHAIIRTGTGQVVLKLDPAGGIVTPGVATVWVP